MKEEMINDIYMIETKSALRRKLHSSNIQDLISMNDLVNTSLKKSGLCRMNARVPQYIISKDIVILTLGGKISQL